MISRLKGTLLTVEPDRVEVETPGGVVYDVAIPGTVAGRLPPKGAQVELRTFMVVRDDAMELYGFVEAVERELFSRLLHAPGVGAKVAASMLSTFTAPRLARALAEKDSAALTQVSGIGKKTAERIFLALSDRVQDLALGPETGEGEQVGAAKDAVSALVSLGYGFAEADQLVQDVLKKGEVGSSEELIRKALAGR